MSTSSKVESNIESSRKEKESWLVLISSFSDPYWRDIPAVLALPKGSKFRFRYREKYLQRDLPSNGSLHNKRALLVHGAREKNGSYRLYAVRSATILDVKSLGSVRIFEFTVDHLAFWDEAIHNSDNSLKNKFVIHLPQGEEMANHFIRDGNYVKNLAFMTEKVENFPGVIEIEEGDTASHFEQLIDILSKEEEFSNASFLWNLRFRKEGEKKNLSPGADGVFTLDEHRYDISFFQYAPNLTSEHFKPPISLKISLEKQNFRPIAEKQVIYGKYDKLTFRFRTTTPDTDQYSIVRIEPTSEYNKTEFNIDFPVVAIQVKLRKMGLQNIIYIVAAGLLLFGGSSVASSSLSKLAKELDPGLALIFLSIGALAILIGSIALYRYLGVLKIRG